MKGINPSDRVLLAMHSCSEEFGVAIVNLGKAKPTFTKATFPVGKELSKKLFSCIEEILPTSSWKQITRIAVATGPGGFTSTRLSVVLARTLGQQIGCHVDGFSRFELMASRLSKNVLEKEKDYSFWITEELPRRGIVAGEYLLKRNSDIKGNLEIKEITVPRIFPLNKKIHPSIKAEENISMDVITLARMCLKSHLSKKESHWRSILPIYPTSPIDNQNEI